MTTPTHPDLPGLPELLSDNPASSPHRCCFLLHVRPEKLTEYVAAHREVWAEMREALTASGCRNFALCLGAEDGMVGGYCAADGVDAAQRAIGEAAISPRWEAAMAEYFAPGGGEKQILPAYFHLD